MTTKYKVGDKVRVLKSRANDSDFVKDEIVEIIDVYEPGRTGEFYEARSVENGDWFISRNYIEPVGA